MVLDAERWWPSRGLPVLTVQLDDPSDLGAAVVTRLEHPGDPSPPLVALAKLLEQVGVGALHDYDATPPSASGHPQDPTSIPRLITDGGGAQWPVRLVG